MDPPDPRPVSRLVGRYAIYEKIASGGMAAVHFGRLLGSVGFSRTVAVKRLHPHFTEDPDFVSMFLDEARLAARIRHMNVVPTLDVVADEGELFLVMEYVHGETLGRILRILAPRRERVPLPVVATIFSGVLRGLHAAHEAKSERGVPLEIVHRDVSPQNVIVGIDGVARVLDFGVARAVGRLQTTRAGQLKGKIAYMAPEQFGGAQASRQTDVYSAAVCLWETLTGKRLYEGETEAAVVQQILSGNPRRPSELRDDMPFALDPVVLRGLDRDPAKRFPTARDMAAAIEAALPQAVPAAVAAWLEQVAAESIARQAEQLAAIENASSDVPVVPPIDADATVPSPPPVRTPEPAPAPPPVEAALDSAPRSQMSSVSLSRTSASEVPIAGWRGRGRAVVLGAAGITAALVAVIALSLRSAGAPPAASDTATGTATATAIESSTATATATATSIATEPATPIASAPTSATPPASATATERPRPATAVHAPAAPPAPAPAKRSPPAAKGNIVFTNPG